MPSRRSVRRRPLTQERSARAALDIVQESGYAAVSMRAVAERLDTGQAHVARLEELGGGSLVAAKPWRAAV